MKERPILFSAPMIRAILAGRKTQTRRAYKNRKHPDWGCDMAACELVREQQHVIDRSCPYGQPRDRLWVRETTINVEEHGYVGPVYLESDEGRSVLDYGLGPPDDVTEVEPADIRKRPAIHMPRWACRILLEITGIRLERLNDISEAGPSNDCTEEGIFHCGMECPTYEEWHGKGFRSVEKFMYRKLWEQINGPGSWGANPWVWVIEFRRLP
jgi:hypothetical protein